MNRLKVGEFGKYYKKWDMYKFRQFGTDPYYAGVVEINQQVKARNENGLHEAMLTKDEHEKLKTIFLGSYRPRGATKQYNPEFPMNKLLCCDSCGCKLTGSRKHSGFFRENGQPRKTIKYYWKYRCRGCGKEFHRLDVHSRITKHFGKFEYKGHQNNEFVEALKTVWRQKQSDKLNSAKLLSGQIKKLEKIKSGLVVSMASESAEYTSDIRQELDKTKVQIAELQVKLSDSSRLDDDLVDFVKFGLDYGEKLKHDWWSLEHEDRQRCQQLLFPGGITISANGKVSTHGISPIYRLATNKKDLRNARKSLLVELVGTAPTSASVSI
jgi:hypothetical protein